LPPTPERDAAEDREKRKEIKLGVRVVELRERKGGGHENGFRFLSHNTCIYCFFLQKIILSHVPSPIDRSADLYYSAESNRENTTKSAGALYFYFYSSLLFVSFWV
jgi:hypothetical protein